MPITNNNLFATPDSMGAMTSYLETFHGGERVAAVTAAGMMWNLAAVEAAEDTTNVIAAVCTAIDDSTLANAALIMAAHEARASLDAVMERLQINDMNGEEAPFIEDCKNAIAMIDAAINNIPTTKAINK